jgi:hypothetical protein
VHVNRIIIEIIDNVANMQVLSILDLMRTSLADTASELSKERLICRIDNENENETGVSSRRRRWRIPDDLELTVLVTPFLPLSVWRGNFGFPL